MKKYIEKITLWAIYILLGVTLLTPLTVDSNFFFPFITPKVLMFRTAVEAMLVLYFLLLALNKQYRPQVNAIFLSLCAFVLVAFISSYFGPNFYRSFWGDMERSEGLLLWLHLLAYFFVLINVLRTRKHWQGFIEFSLIIALLVSLFALGQFFNVEHLLRTTGSRLEATIGNPAFLAAYLIFHIAFAVYLFRQKSALGWRIYYSILAVLFTFIAVQTQTRGALLGLAAGVFITALLLVFQKRTSKKIKRSGMILIGILFAFAVIVFSSRETEWIKNFPTLYRFATISLTDRTTQTRILTWQAGWKGWKENFILGNGMETFHLTFDKYFPPLIFEDEGSRVWFDRAHNFIFDKGVTTGAAGLLLYLFFIFYPGYYFFKHFFRHGKNVWFSSIFIGLTAAFIVQNLFIFEAVVVYFLLFFTWAFLSSFLPQKQLPEILSSKSISLPIFIALLIAFFPVMNVVNVQPAKAAHRIVLAENMADANGDFFAIVERYKSAMEMNTYGQREMRIRYFEYVGATLRPVGAVVDQVKPVLEYTENLLDDFTQNSPLNVQSYLVPMRFYNFTAEVYAGKELERLDKALSYYPKLLELSPNRAHIYYETAVSHLYKYRIYVRDNKPELAQTEFNEAEKSYQQALDLNDKVLVSYFNIIQLYLNADEDEKVAQTLKDMEEVGVSILNDSILKRLAKLALNNDQYDWVAYFHELRIPITPDPIEAYTQIALAYAYLGQDSKAIEAAQEVIAIGDETQKFQAESFIQEVRQGKYKNQ